MAASSKRSHGLSFPPSDRSRLLEQGESTRWWPSGNIAGEPPELHLVQAYAKRLLLPYAPEVVRLRFG